jgi:hypothetical protein
MIKTNPEAAEDSQILSRFAGVCRSMKGIKRFNSSSRNPQKCILVDNPFLVHLN